MQFTWSNFKKAKTARTIGSRLSVDLPLLGMESILAKIDTGAFSGALHATSLREGQDSSGQWHLRFAPLGSQNHTIEVDSYHKRRIKSSNGISSIRYAIDTDVTIRGESYPITLTLTNRSAMRHPMLIGRNFLRLHGFLVDVNHKH